jgi:hypothetical protein
MPEKRILTNILSVLVIATTSVAAERQVFDEREMRYVELSAKQPVQQFNPVRPPSSENPEWQRRETPNSGQPSTDFRSPQTVSIDRLKLRSDSLAEYQFEQIQTVTLQSPDPAPQVLEPQQNEAVVEETLQEQTFEEIASAEESESTEDAATTEQVIAAHDGSPKFKIIEEQNRIIVLQVDSPVAPAVNPR